MVVFSATLTILLRDIEFEEVKPRLEALNKAYEGDLAKAADLERRIGAVLRQYATRVRPFTFSVPQYVLS